MPSARMRRMKLAYAATVLLALPFYLPRLFRSFWVDEAITFWMAHDGFRAAIEKCSHIPGQSILYGAIASLFCLDGGPWREPLLRLPSVIGLGLMLFFTTRLAARAMGAAAGLCAFVLMLFLPLSMDVYIQARPYGLASAAVAASFYLLYEWVEKRERRFAVGYAVATLLIFYLHYLYVVALIAQAFYLAWVFGVEKQRARWKDLAAAILGVALLVLPLVRHLQLLLREGHTLPFAAKPTEIGFLRTLAPPELILAGFCAGVLIWFLAVIWKPGRGEEIFPSRGWAVMVVGWWAASTVILFLVSRLTVLQVFLPRYLGSSGPAMAVLLTAVAMAVFGPRMALRWAWLAVFIATATPTSWRAARYGGSEEAGPAIAAIRAISPAQPPPLFFQSSLPESNFLDWRKGPSGNYFYSELIAYPVPNRVLPLPARIETDVKEHMAALLDGELKSAPVLLYAHYGELPEWVRAQMTARGYRVETQQPGDYTLAVFRK